MAKGKTIDEAKNIIWKQTKETLEKLPPIKIHCAVLAVDVLKTAIENYEHIWFSKKQKTNHSG